MTNIINIDEPFASLMMEGVVNWVQTHEPIPIRGEAIIASSREFDDRTRVMWSVIDWKQVMVTTNDIELFGPEKNDFDYNTIIGTADVVDVLTTEDFKQDDRVKGPLIVDDSRGEYFILFDNQQVLSHDEKQEHEQLKVELEAS